jgi:hypothetical protein
MPRYVIHIGPPKTGSKYLQSILFHSRAALLRDGICYPDNWWTAPDQIMHEPLLHALRTPGAPNVAEPFRRINAAGHRVVVLSCEGFDDLNPDQIKLLRDAIGDHPVDIVYYCRRWSERIPSDWQQHIKMGQFPTLPEFYVPYLRSPTDTAAVNYSLVWDKYSRVFGRDSLRLVSYNNLKDHKVDMFRHFASTFLGWAHEPSFDKGLIQANISPNLYDTEILRVLNWIDYQAVRRFRLNMRVIFQELRPRWDTRALTEMMADDAAMLEIRDDAEPFRASWDAMATYADRLVSKEFGEEIFRRNTVGFRYIRSNYLLKDKAVGALKALYQAMQNADFHHSELS